MNITIIGAGNAGCAHAALLSIRNHKVTLLKTSKNVNDENFETIKRQGGIHLEDNIKQTKSFVKINKCTRNVQEALTDETQIILIMTQTLQHKDVVKLITPFVRTGQIILFIPGYLGSLYCYYKLNREDIIIGEGESTPYDARIIRPGVVNLLFRNIRNAIAFVKNEDEKYLNLVNDLLDAHKYLRTNVFESALHNPNLVVHTIGAIMSASRIENAQGEFWMYKEAFSDSIWNIVRSLDKEKNEVIKAYGGSPLDYIDACKWRNEEDLNKDGLDVFKGYAANGGPKGPASLNTRFIYEDVPKGLCLLENLAKRKNILSPITTSLIELANSLNNINYRALAYSLAELGLD